MNNKKKDIGFIKGAMRRPSQGGIVSRKSLALVYYIIYNRDPYERLKIFNIYIL